MKKFGQWLGVGVVQNREEKLWIVQVKGVDLCGFRLDHKLQGEQEREENIKNMEFKIYIRGFYHLYVRDKDQGHNKD